MIKPLLGIFLNIAGIFIIWGRLKILYWGYGKTWVKLGQFLRDDRIGDGLMLLTIIGAILIAAGWVVLFSCFFPKKSRVG